MFRLGLALTLSAAGAAQEGAWEHTTPSASAQDWPERLRLDNGLQVILHPSKAAPKAAVIVLFSIGEAQDPPGKSGMAHLIEHCYVTSAAGGMAARTVQEYLQEYPDGWNAQTGLDYTVIAAVVPRERVKQELIDAATRMGKLRIEQGDLDREKPRMERELANMYGGIPKIACANHARATAFPTPAGARKGGVEEQITKINLDELRARTKRYYKPGNATLAIVGGFDRDDVAKLIRKHFGSLPTGDPVPPPRERPEPKLGGVDAIEVPTPRFGKPTGYAALAFAAPGPRDELFVPFLVLVARFSQQAMLLRREEPNTDCMAVWTPVDGPEVVKISASLDAAEDVPARLKKLVAEWCEVRDRDLKSALSRAKSHYGFLLGLTPVNDMWLARGNIYGIAFGYARRQQLGMDPREITAKIDRVTLADLRRCAKEVFGPDRGAAAVVRVRGSGKGK